MQNAKRHARQLLGIAAMLTLCACDRKAEVAPSMQTNVSASTISSPADPTDAVTPMAQPESTKTVTEQSKDIDLSDTTDPSSLARLFFGEVIAIGYGLDMAVDEQLKFMITAALADEVQDDITPESIRAAYKKANLLSIENGNVVWEGRKLPAAIVTIDVATVNRAAGTYGHFCVKLGGVRDSEFDYIRAPIRLFCDKNKAEVEQTLEHWKKELHFATTQTF